MAEAAYQDINIVFSDIINRIRSLEGKYNLLGERLLVVNQNMIADFKESTTEFKLINSELKEVKKEIFNLREAMKDFTRELNFLATKQEFKVLEKYINLWNPMNFVTQKDLEKAINELKKDGR